MNKDSIPVLLAVGCVAAFLLLAAGCGMPTLTASLSPTGGAAEPAANSSPLASPTAELPVQVPSPEEEHTPTPSIPTRRLAGPSPQSGEPVPGTPLPPPERPSPGTGPEEAVGLAMEDLAQRLGVEPEAIVLVKVYSDDFPASNLGCPSPKVTLPPIPAFVIGQEIILEVDGQRYVYRARGRLVVFCGSR